MYIVCTTYVLISDERNTWVMKTLNKHTARKNKLFSLGEGGSATYNLNESFYTILRQGMHEITKFCPCEDINLAQYIRDKVYDFDFDKRFLGHSGVLCFAS